MTMKNTTRTSCPVSSRQRVLPVVDMFSSLRGEGRYIGHPAIYIVLKDCDGDCLCGEDLQIIDGSSSPRPRFRSTKDIAESALQIAFQTKLPLESIHAVVTGLEPMTHQPSIAHLVEHLRELGLSFVELDTRGIHLPSRELLESISWWSCSPSLRSLPLYTALMAILNTGRCEFKFTIHAEQDIERMESRYMPPLPAERVVLMPPGITVDEQAQQIPWLLEQGLDRGYCVSPRIHMMGRAINSTIVRTRKTD